MHKWKDISEDFIELEGATAWLRKPLSHNKHLIVSWRMAGSEITKASIVENFESITEFTWGKSHSILDDTTANILLGNKTKVVVAITDPREVAINLLSYDNGYHYYDFDYQGLRKTNHRLLLKMIADKQINLINYYKKTFKDDCLILRYEDVVFNRTLFYEKIASFFNEQPLKIDGVEKYKSSMYKNCGHFDKFISKETINSHYEKYKTFYEEWEYPLVGLAGLKYWWCTDET